MSEHQQQRYRVVEKLESGGMAEVFRAESEGLQGFKKQVAIKRVLPHLSEKKRFIAMFLDEARLSAQLSHSNCVQVFDIGVGDNAYFIVMEYVDGANLKAIAEGEGPRQSLLALGYAGWGPGQLESEIVRNSWLNVPADPALVFAFDIDRVWERALAMLGASPTSLSSEAGHA